MGPSGAGKSTPIRIISSLERPDEGIVSLRGEVWDDSSKNIYISPQKGRLGLVFQEYALFAHLSVRKNVSFAAVDRNCIQDLLDRFGIESFSIGVGPRQHTKNYDLIR
ncbi:ATP-binding cassette domain-containing protein [Desulfosediminicola flagellatus]|uniref:ATP-binding cassette domain-containing protein n=1 Tax=Desulfosediminicola flagellatus TaxID=2569541 RepID=UPI003B83542A